jgi:hypothetical protein
MQCGISGCRQLLDFSRLRVPLGDRQCVLVIEDDVDLKVEDELLSALCNAMTSPSNVCLQQPTIDDRRRIILAQR